MCLETPECASRAGCLNEDTRVESRLSSNCLLPQVKPKSPGKLEKANRLFQSGTDSALPGLITRSVC